MRLPAPEALVTVVGLAIAGAAVAETAGTRPAVQLGAGLASAAILARPAVRAVRRWLLDLLLDRGDTGRALAVARRARAATRGARALAAAELDLGLVHLAAAEPGPAAAALEAALAAGADDEVRPVAELHLALALGHLGRELDRALALARTARAALAPGDGPLVDHVLGLVLLRRGETTAAVRLLEAALADPEADLLPSPGERAAILAEALEAEGRAAEARARLALAAAVRPEGPWVARARALAARRP